MRTLSVADYLVEFFIANGVSDVFGYQGGMVCHIIDSLGKYRNKINYHNCGNEQGAAFAACGYAQVTGKLGVCITTSGPGFTNAITGLANAWFDSIPLMLISGQVNTKDKRRNYTIRQYGFQEIQTIKLADGITKQTYEIDVNTDIPSILNEAYKLAFSDRKGPVFLDFPINIEREIIEVDNRLKPVVLDDPLPFDAEPYINQLMVAKNPVIIAGAGINQCGLRCDFLRLVNLLKIPVVTTMPGIDLIPSDSPFYVGFLGGTARREAGIVLRKTDCVLALGTRMCNKAIGYNHADFIPNAMKLFRVDTDTSEFERKLKDCEEDIHVDLCSFITSALSYSEKLGAKYDHSSWVKSVNEMKKLMAPMDLTFGNKLVKHFTELILDNSCITLDVGNNQVYGAQSSVVKENTRIFASYGLGSMGYAIPSAIGVAIGGKRVTCAISGDGGAQMNIQELNTISKNNLPIKVLVLNNHALGHIILFQEHYLDNRLVATSEKEKDYFSCDFSDIAKAYGLRSYKVFSIDELSQYKEELRDNKPLLIEVEFDDCTMLPNIHGGLDPLVNGPTLPKGLVDRIKEIMEM